MAERILHGATFITQLFGIRIGQIVPIPFGFQLQTTGCQIGGYLLIHIVRITLLEIIDMIPLGLELPTSECSQILPQINVIVIVSFGNIEELTRESLFQQGLRIGRDPQHTEWMAVGQRIGFYQFDSPMQITLTHRHHIGKPCLLLDPETDQQETIDYGKFAVVQKTPAAHIGKRKVTILVITGPSKRCDRLFVLERDRFKRYLHKIVLKTEAKIRFSFKFSSSK